MKKLYITCFTALLFIFLTNTVWGQIIIASEGFNSTTSLFTVSGGAYYTGNSGANDGPANSPFAVEGTHSYGKSNGSATLISQEINTAGFTGIQMTLRVAAFSLLSVYNGMDATDYVKIEISTNGGSSYFNNIEVKGFNNSYWAYATGTGNATTFFEYPQTYSPAGSGERTTDGYSTITITNIPTNINIKIRITLYNNSSNELWIIDDFKITATSQISTESPVLIFSEYIEGSSYNKAIELYNASLNTINLSDYTIIQFNNGASRTSGLRYAFTLTNPTYISPGSTFTIAHNQASTALQNLANFTTNSNVLLFNGDDALAIYNATDVSGTTISINAVEIDIFGQIGLDPGTEWGSGLTSTYDNTLRRKSTVYYQVRANPIPFDPALEYNGYEIDTYDGLGFHNFGGEITSSKNLPSRTYTELTLNGSNVSVSFLENSVIKNTLTITQGLLKLRNTILTVNGTLSITNPGLNNMIILDDGNYFGTLKVKASTNGAYNFHIGDTRGTAEYSPATVTFTSGTYNDAYLTVQMKNEKHPDNTSTTDYLKRYWTFSTSGITNITYDIDLKYTDADISGTENLIRFGKYDGSIWENLGPPDYNNNKLYKTGLTGFSSFTGGVESAMPVHLAGFSSSVNGRNVKLNWITENEENNAGFEVQKTEFSHQESKWKNIGFIQGQGNSKEPVSYNFEDKNLSSGKYKYRLKQIDYNGNYEYFELENEVVIGVPKKIELAQNYPNPFNPVTNINFDLPEKGLVMLKIYDLLGREVTAIVNELKEAGYYTVQFNAGNLSSGIYFYRLSANGMNKVKKLVVIK